MFGSILRYCLAYFCTLLTGEVPAAKVLRPGVQGFSRFMVRVCHRFVTSSGRMGGAELYPPALKLATRLRVGAPAGLIHLLTLDAFP